MSTHRFFHRRETAFEFFDTLFKTCRRLLVLPVLFLFLLVRYPSAFFGIEAVASDDATA